MSTDSHLYLFKFGYNQFTEFAVKLVDVIGSLKCAARFENMLLLVRQKRIPVTAQTVITDVLEQVEGFGFIPENHAPLFEQTYLIRKGYELFGIRCLVRCHGYIK